MTPHPDASNRDSGSIIPTRNLLLVEDSEDDVFLLKRALARHPNLRVVGWAENGNIAISYLSGTDGFADREQHPWPDIMILDLKMPGTDGFEVLQWARAEPELKRLLIVVLTSSHLQSDVDRAYELGANSYLVKPVEFSEMVNLIQRFEAYWTELNRIPSSPRPPTVLPVETNL